jgi:Domain of unknown function (DUF1844)
MNEPTLNTTRASSREDVASSVFAQMVVQLSNMALMMLGRVPNPQSGETIEDTDAARMFIDQLEMLETKTKGNLTKEEDRLLKQSLTGLRMAFVEAIENPSANRAAADRQEQPTRESNIPGPSVEVPSSSTEEESRKKFTKKY